ncbi:MAG: hypothetical protein IKL48_04305 [Elusimicrobiaceae bacterium]|nr:hypothetical protein [Elusimicrobiaceae bacterium]
MSTRKIKRFKISTRQKEITRKVLRLGLDLPAAGIDSEIALARFVVELAQKLDPGTVYEFNENVLWDLGAEVASAQGMFSACAVTLGKNCTDFADSLSPAKQLISQTVLFEFLRTATLFVADLIKEQAEKEECEALEPQFIYIPKLGLAPEPKLFKDSPRLDLQSAEKILPELLKQVQAEKIDASLENGKILPQATVVFIIPWQKKKRKGKK